MSSSETGRIGPYALRGVLGRGGSATVYRAHDPELNREVAIKVLTAREGLNPVMRERFRREARAVARLRHPNIVSIYTSGEDQGVPYLVMELFPAGSLSRRLGRPLAPADAAILIRQIGAALDFAHAQGFVHRDVKPANIFLDGSRAVLADFGIVKALTGEVGTRLTEAQMSVGTPEYTAPEQALGEPLDGRADLYALGVVLYEILTGTPPYEGALVDVLNQHVEGKVPDPRRRNPALTPALATVLLKALARYPEGRYQSGAAFADALDAAIARGNEPGAGEGLGAPDRTARTLLIDLQREQLSGTQIHERPKMPGVDQTVVIPFEQLPGGGGARPPTVNIPPLPNLSPQAPPAPRADATARPDPTVVGYVAPDATQTPAGRAAPDDTGRTVVEGYRPPQGTPRAGAPPAPIYTPPIPPPPPQPLPQQPPFQQPPPQQVPVLAQPAGSRGPNLALVGGLAALVVLLLAGGLAAWFVLGRDRDNPAPPTITPVAQGSAAPQASVPATGGTPGAGGTRTPLPSGAAGASASATAALAADPARQQIEAGDRALADGKFGEAVATYREALKINPNSAVANRQLGLTLWIWNHEAGEIDFLRTATRLAPNDALAWAYLSYSAIDTHQVELAFAAAQAAVNANPNLAEAYTAVANTYLRYPPDTTNPEANYDAAQEAMKRARALDPEGLWVLWFDSQLLQTTGKYDESLVPLDKMIALRPNWPTLYYAKGGVYHGKADIAEARRWQERALALDPEYPNALTELGWLSFEEGDYPKAIEYFQLGLRTTDDVNDYAHAGYGFALAAQGDTANALTRCRRAVQIDPRAPLGYQCLGMLFLNDLQQLDDALGNYRKVIELRPQWESGYIGVGRVFDAQRNYVEAEKVLRQGVERVKEPKYITFWLGLALYRQQKYEEALPHFAQATQLAANDPGVHFWYGLNLERLQRLPEARTAYERALALDPNYQEAKDALERLRRQGF